MRETPEIHGKPTRNLLRTLLAGAAIFAASEAIPSHAADESRQPTVCDNLTFAKQDLRGVGKMHRKKELLVAQGVVDRLQAVLEGMSCSPERLPRKPATACQDVLAAKDHVRLGQPGPAASRIEDARLRLGCQPNPKDTERPDDTKGKKDKKAK